MSDPSLLEDHLISSCPLKDRFPGMNSRVPHATQILFSFRTRLRCLAVYRVFSATLPLKFAPQSVPENRFTMVQEFHLGKPRLTQAALKLKQFKTVLEARGFRPIYSVRMSLDRHLIGEGA